MQNNFLIGHRRMEDYEEGHRGVEGGQRGKGKGMKRDGEGHMGAEGTEDENGRGWRGH